MIHMYLCGNPVEFHLFAHDSNLFYRDDNLLFLITIWGLNEKGVCRIPGLIK